MFNKLFLIINLYLLAAYALPTDPPTNLKRSWPVGIKRATQAIPVLEIDYRKYPQSAENICYSWHCNKGPRRVAPDRGAADAHRDSNSCGGRTNRCSTNFETPHAGGFQCDEWPWASSTAGGKNVATRCIPARDNAGSGSVWGNFINNKGPQKPGRPLIDGTDFAEINVTNIPNDAHFCLAELRDHKFNPKDCTTVDVNQPYLQQKK